MDNDSSPAQDPAVPAAPADNPNDLATDLTEEQEQAFVDETLGIDAKSAEPESPPEEPKAPESPEEPVSTESETPKEPDTPEPAPEEPKTPADISGPDASDLWIEVQNSEGKSVKLVYDPSDPGSFLPDDFTFKNDKHLYDVLEAKGEMATLYKERVGEYESEVEERETKENEAKSQAEQSAAWDAEIQDLVDGGFLEEPKAKPTDKNFLEDPTVQKIDSVFKFMKEQNTARLEDGRPLLRSFGTAFNLYNKGQEAAAVETKKKQENDMAKARGSLVGGTSAASGSEPALYKRGSASNIWNVPIPD